MSHPSDVMPAPAGALPEAPAFQRRPRGRAAKGISNLLRGVRGSESGWPDESLAKARAPLALWCLLLYGFVVHSAKLRVGQEALIAGIILVLVHGAVRFPRPLVWLGAYTVWAAVTAPMSSHFEKAIGGAYEFAKVWVIAFLVVNTIRNRAHLRFFTIGWLALFGLFPVRGVLVSWLGGYGGSFGGRIGWNFSFANPNDLAALALMPIALCIGLLQVERVFWLRLAALAGVAATTLVLVLTQSRGGQLALGTLGLLTVLSQRNKKRILMAVGAAGVLVAFAVPPKYFDRVLNLQMLTGGTANVGKVDKDGSAIQRLNIWKVALHIVAENPLQGAGIGTYPLAHGDAWRDVEGLEGDPSGQRDAHSTFLRIAAETGLVGFGLWCTMLFSTWRAAWRSLPRLRRDYPGMDQFVIALVIGQIAFLQAGIFNSFGHQPFLYIYVMLTSVTIHYFANARPAGVPVAEAPRTGRRWGRSAPVPGPVAPTPAAPLPESRPSRIPGRRGGLAYGFDGLPPAGR
jgi:O-antigen ligase